MNDNTHLNRLPLYTWLGLAILIGGEILLLLNQMTVITWFTPLMWTGYILAMDGWLRKRTGSSWLTDHLKEFPFLILVSVGIWVLFEAYNIHLRNWFYLGVPSSSYLQFLAYFWSFATIIPGVFITSQIIASIFRLESDNLKQLPDLGPHSLWFLIGLAMVTIPLAVPGSIARYLFGSVWIGFILLVDPINELLGAPSFRRMLSDGDRSKIIALLVGGFICGLLWEAWNYQAFLQDGGHWIYTVPNALRIFGLHYGQMPILGMLGFPPFALELYAMYHFLRRMIEGETYIGPVYW
ncbi:MAG: hypothetical protein PVG04_06115 [Anaerolineales bacterium]|jgi:hypothetical protein